MCRYVRSYNVTARRVGYVSLFIFVTYLLVGLVMFVQFYTAMYSSGWDGSDPVCIRYMQGILKFIFHFALYSSSRQKSQMYLQRDCLEMAVVGVRHQLLYMPRFDPYLLQAKAIIISTILWAAHIVFMESRVLGSDQ